MEDKDCIEMDIADAIIERPIGFKIGQKSFCIYPPSLGKSLLISRLIDNLEINDNTLARNPYLEALRLCSVKRSIVCRILSYYTFSMKSDIVDNCKVNRRSALFMNKLDAEEMATLLVTVFSIDNTNRFIKAIGIDKDKECQKKISEIRKDNSVISFGGKSLYGTLIDFACQRYGWTVDYVVWGISYTNLKMLIADSISTVHLSKEEKAKLMIFDNVDLINADDPVNMDLIDRLLQD